MHLDSEEEQVHPGGVRGVEVDRPQSGRVEGDGSLTAQVEPSQVVTDLLEGVRGIHPRVALQQRAAAGVLVQELADVVDPPGYRGPGAAWAGVVQHLLRDVEQSLWSARRVEVRRTAPLRDSLRR